ncbi:uncharacterized protein EI90DRAFT_2837129, partial [Cantharellus anzutake]|uniref:uncharacterized protein n=1 Tax=Cantharellus anzutake TaxID=1750568 RepID=UPI0019055EE4
QRALKGHIIVFPTTPEALAPFLPPPLEDVVTPMCVVFVGSHTPSKEWLLSNARPLLVRQEKVRAALQWLIANNPLYSDVVLHEGNLAHIPHHDIAPVPIEVHHATVASDAPGSHYDDPLVNVASDDSIPSHFSNLLPSVLVTDLDMCDATSAEMTAAALCHLKRASGEIGGHIQVVNHYSDPHLLPLLYPTLYPYGIGGYHPSCASPLSLPRMAKHL